MTIQAADPKERRRTLYVIAAIGVFAGLGFWGYSHWSKHLDLLLATDQIDAAKAQVDTAIHWIRMLLSACCVGAALLLAQLIRQSAQQDRFPPTQAKLLGAMTIRSGEAKRGWLINIGVVVLLLILGAGFAFPVELFF